jgi:hypothetical protein
MTSIGSLLSPAQRQAIEAAALTVVEPEGVRVTLINGVEYDLRSEAMAETTCADCPQALRVEVAPEPSQQWLMAGRTREEFHDLLTSQPRVAVCEECGLKRVAGKRGTLIHHNPQEKPVIDLSQYSEAELARLAVEARTHMVRTKADALPAKRKKAEKAERKRIAKDEALKVEQCEQRRGLVLPDLSIPIKGQVKYIPALDLSEVTDMNVVISPKERSPYNKALYAMGRDLLGKDTATYSAVADLHAELMEHSGAPVAKPAKKKGKKAKAERPSEALVAVIEPDVKAKVAAFAEITGMSKKQARKHLEKVGVLAKA